MFPWGSWHDNDSWSDVCWGETIQAVSIGYDVTSCWNEARFESFCFWLITTKMEGALFFQNLICWIIRNLVVLHQLVASTCGVRVVPCTGRNLVGSTFGILWCSFLWASWCGIASMARGAVIIDVDSSLIKWDIDTANWQIVCFSSIFFYVNFLFFSYWSLRELLHLPG